MPVNISNCFFKAEKPNDTLDTELRKRTASKDTHCVKSTVIIPSNEEKG
jgi:hypothetical protein